jgi:hypothetical protein
MQNGRSPSWMLRQLLLLPHRQLIGLTSAHTIGDSADGTATSLFFTLSEDGFYLTMYTFYLHEWSTTIFTTSKPLVEDLIVSVLTYKQYTFPSFYFCYKTDQKPAGTRVPMRKMGMPMAALPSLISEYSHTKRDQVKLSQVPQATLQQHSTTLNVLPINQTFNTEKECC